MMEMNDMNLIILSNFDMIFNVFTEHLFNKLILVLNLY